MDDMLNKMEKLAMPFLDEAGIVLFDLHIRRYRRDIIVELLVDRPNGGITLDECSTIHRHLRDALALENLFSDNYTLEVSSPGVDRILKTKKDFVRIMNREVRFFLTEPVAERIEYDGVVRNVDDDNVVIDFREQEVVISILKINKAKQVI